MSEILLLPSLTLAETLAIMTRHLEQADIDEPRREARLLLTHALDIDLAALISGEARLLGVAAPRATNMLSRRCRQEPLSRILGWREFYGLEFRLNAATLDPRPDTETLVDAVLAHMAATGRTESPLRVLDLGTGTGAILIALLSRLPKATGIGVDIAPDAVSMAEANARTLGFGARAEFRCGDLMEGVRERFDILVSNPPYISSGDLPGLEPEVLNHDPHRALDGGEDGLAFYRRILRDAPMRLIEGGLIGLELGAGQANDARMMMELAGFSDIRTTPDLGGIERALLGIAARNTREEKQ